MALEAAGSATFLGSELGQDLLSKFIWSNDDRPDLRMEAVFILSELRNNKYSRQELLQIVSSDKFQSDELRQAAVWGLGKAGLKCYEDLLPFIDDNDESVAMHAITAFGPDTPIDIIDRLTEDLMNDNPRRAAASSEVLRIISGYNVIDSLVRAYDNNPTELDWILATLGRMPLNEVEDKIENEELIQKIKPLLLAYGEQNWLAKENVLADMGFLLKQTL